MFYRYGDINVMLVCTFRDMLSPGGRLILCEPLDVSWYMVGGSKFKVLGNTEESIRRAFQEANYEIEEFETFELDDNSDPLISDVKSVYSIIARKI